MNKLSILDNENYRRKRNCIFEYRLMHEPDALTFAQYEQIILSTEKEAINVMQSYPMDNIKNFFNEYFDFIEENEY